MKKLASALVFLSALSMFAESIDGHHSTPLSVDRRHPITLRGTVAVFILRSPHATLSLDARDENGGIVNWTLEGGSIRGFIFMGFTPLTLPPGQEVTVVAFPSVSGGPVGQLSSIILPEGKRYGGGPDPEPAP